jgi:putative tryptophan/tyrosine transport system substrate-binding protein
MKRTILLFLACAGFLVAGGVMTEVSAVERKIAVMWVGKSHRPTDLILGFLPKLRELAPDMQVKLHRQLKSMDEAEAIFHESEKTMDGIVFLDSTGAEFLATANPKIPCFVGATNNPVDLGAMKSLEAPDGKVTGVTYYVPYNKRFEIIMQLFPNTKRVGLVVELADPSGLIEQEATRSQCARLGLKYSDVVASDLKKLIAETNQLADNVDLIIISNTRLAMEFTTSLLPIANTKKIPVFSYASEPVKQGVLAGMGVDEAKLGAMLAESVVDVIVNRKPISRVPVKIDPDPTICINEGMMKSLGLKFPDAILKKAVFY